MRLFQPEVRNSGRYQRSRSRTKWGVRRSLTRRPGTNELLEAPELPVQERGRLTGEGVATLVQQGEDGAGREFAHRPGDLWTDDSDFG